VGDPKRPQEVKKVGAVVVPPADDSMCFTLLVTGLFMGAFALLFQVSAGFTTLSHTAVGIRPALTTPLYIHCCCSPSSLYGAVCS
jgi:hypothetical protein